MRRSGTIRIDTWGGHVVKHKGSSELGYMPQLDALRALAVISVAWFHWMPNWNFGLPLGGAGVQLFFVLSGFLITGILVNVRQHCPQRADTAHAIRAFYARRFLRIFPLYYAVIAAACLVNLPPFRETLAYSLTYTINFYFFIRQDWHGPISHFWSLAVEEQFYLVWPFLMLCCPRRSLAWIAGASVALAWTLNVAVSLAFPRVGLIDVLPITSLGALGGGALLAVFGASSPHAHALSRWCLLLGAPSAILLTVLCAATEPTTFLLALRGIALNLLFVWLVHRAARGFDGAWGRLLQWPVLVSLGTVSYGLYVLHNLMPSALGYSLYLLHRHLPLSADYLPKSLFDYGPVRLVALTLLTLVVTYASWYLFESPLNQLKRHFPYRRHHAPRTPPLPMPLSVGSQPRQEA